MKSIALIDYLKFEVLYDFEDNEHLDKINELFKVLKLNINKFVTTKGINNMEQGREYDEGLLVFYSPNINISAKGPHFIVEMSGYACRTFELRNGSWKDLFIFLSTISFEMLRVDLAKDDVDKILDFNILKQFIRKQQFISTFRSTKKPVPAELKKIGNLWDNLFDYDRNLMTDIASDIDSIEWAKDYREFDKTGFTATFGNKASLLELEIYDKKIERIVNGCPSPLEQWIRFEMKFYHKKAHSLFYLLHEAFKYNKLNQLVSNLLYGMMDFKEGVPDGEYRSHYNRYPTCSWWIDFLGSEVEKLKVSYPTKLDTSLDRSVRWIYSGVAKTLMEIFCTDGEGINLNYIIHDAFLQKLKDGKFTNVEASKVNNYLRSRGLESQIKSHEEMLNSLIKFLSEELRAEELKVEDIYDKNIVKHKNPIHIKEESSDPEFKSTIIQEDLKTIFLEEIKYNRILHEDLRYLVFSGTCPFVKYDIIRIIDLKNNETYFDIRIIDIEQDKFRYKIIFELCLLD